MYLGIDIGSLTCDAVLIDDNEKIIAYSVVPTGARNSESIARSTQDVLREAGISEEDLTIVFKEFQQVDGSSTKTKGGTGLGLSISKKIIEMHGGRIWLTSEIGNGSLTTIILSIITTNISFILFS